MIIHDEVNSFTKNTREGICFGDTKLEEIKHVHCSHLNDINISKSQKIMGKNSKQWLPTLNVNFPIISKKDKFEQKRSFWSNRKSIMELTEGSGGGAGLSHLYRRLNVVF